MSEDTKQPATTDADATAKPETEDKGAPDQTDDFDKALAEYGEVETKPSSEQPKPKSEAKADDETLTRLKRLEQEQAERVYREDLGHVIKGVRGDFATDEVDDEFIETWINAQAKRDIRLANAWAKRHDDPSGFKRVVKGLAQKFAEKHSKLRKQDQDATDTREAVADAVRRGSGKPPEGKAPDFKDTSNAEFREKVKKEYGYTPRV
jgi:hypothetical protein